MALDTTVAALALSDSLMQKNGLLITPPTPDIEVLFNLDGTVKFDNAIDYPSDFADAYDDYATLGVVPGATNAGGTKSLIETAMNSISGNTIANATILGTAFANYWATVAIIPGTPAHGGSSVISVVNNAATLSAAFTAAIIASITASSQYPYFETFLDNIEGVVSTIVWIVTELIVITPTAFPETIT